MFLIVVILVLRIVMPVNVLVVRDRMRVGVVDLFLQMGLHGLGLISIDRPLLRRPVRVFRDGDVRVELLKIRDWRAVEERGGSRVVKMRPGCGECGTVELGPPSGECGTVVLGPRSGECGTVVMWYRCTVVVV